MTFENISQINTESNLCGLLYYNITIDKKIFYYGIFTFENNSNLFIKFENCKFENFYSLSNYSFFSIFYLPKFSNGNIFLFLNNTIFESIFFLDGILKSFGNTNFQFVFKNIKIINYNKFYFHFF